jgi:DNA-binding transcriptional LysR family regulator
MQFQSLSVFCEVVRYRSFSRAAAATGYTQSAVSQIVQQLEDRLGVQLLNRGTRPLQLTSLGQVYYEGCKELVEKYLELEASVKGAQARRAATVRVAAIYSVGLGDMGQSVERFRAQHPEAAVQIEYHHPDRVCEKVLDGTADLGLLSFPRKSRELTALPWREEEMVVTCAPGHPLAGQKAVRPGQLNGEKCIGFDRHLAIRREVDRFFREQGVAVDVALEFDNIETIKKAVEIAAGIALLPEPTLRREVEAGTLVAVPLAGCRLVRPLSIIHRRHNALSSTAVAFVDLLRQANGTGPSSRPEVGLFAGGTGPQARTKPLHRSRNGAARTSKRTGT